MQLLALEVCQSNLALITLLNGGATPSVEETKTFFVFDPTWNSDIPNMVISAEDFERQYEFSILPHLLSATKV